MLTDDGLSSLSNLTALEFLDLTSGCISDWGESFAWRQDLQIFTRIPTNLPDCVQQSTAWDIGELIIQSAEVSNC